MLQNKYQIISLEDVKKFIQKESNFSKIGMLFTFDDGLSDHFEAAKILHKHGIKGVFYIPTCILYNEPANPNIIHYCLANYGVGRFVSEYNHLIKKFELDEKLKMFFDSKNTEPWKAIKEIKNTFKYKLEYMDSRKILLAIYKKTLFKDFPNAMEIIHLTKEKIIKMVEMGHSVGVHTHTHISIAPSKLTKKEFEKEIIFPKKILEKELSITVDSLSYPFGEKQDCFSSSELLKKTNQYQIAFTVETILNTTKNSSFSFGRYQPLSTDSIKNVEDRLDRMVMESK
jgi:peptidoglycan/xylan/chitin deacetylase (PgdA/CDA1 family)